MSRRSITPVARERAFNIEELFFSITDRKGVISSGNDVFVEVSGLRRDELVGHAHNVVRHPDMPRAVFEVFWTYLQDGRSIAAYVKNMSADGSYYWVMASAVPFDGGYLSIRLKPTSAYLAQVQEIYTTVAETERAVEAGDVRNRKEAIRAGVSKLHELIADAGFADYDAFMQAALAAEVTARDELLGSPAHERLAAGSQGERRLREIIAGTGRSHERLHVLVRNLSEYARLSQDFAEKSRFVIALADDMGLFSLNAMIAAIRLGNDGASLGAIAKILRTSSDEAVPIIESLRTEISHTVTSLGDLSLRVAASKLQAEMIMVFLTELLSADTDEVDAEVDVARDLGVLAEALRGGVSATVGALDALDDRFDQLLKQVDALERNFNIMRALEVNGRIEAARSEAGDSVEFLFRTIAERVMAAREELAGFSDVARMSEQRDRESERRLVSHVDEIRAQVGELASP